MNTLWVRVIPGLAVAFSLVTIAPPVFGQSVTVRQTAFRVKDIAWGNSRAVDRRTHNLLTAPKTLDEMFRANLPSHRYISRVGDAMPTARSLTPKPVNPTDALTDPTGTLQKFLSQKPPEPQPIMPLEFFKIPSMESGVQLDVWKF